MWLHKDKATPNKSNVLLIRYCKWVRVDKKDIIVIDIEKHNINAVNLTYCDDIMISDNAADGLIDTDVDDGD